MSRDYSREYEEARELDLLSQFASPANYRNNAHLMPHDDRSDLQKALDSRVEELEWSRYQYDRR